MVHRFHDVDREARMNFVNGYLCAVYDGEILTTDVLFNEEALFHLSEYWDCQNNKYWSA